MQAQGEQGLEVKASNTVHNAVSVMDTPETLQDKWAPEAKADTQPDVRSQNTPMGSEQLAKEAAKGPSTPSPPVPAVSPSSDSLPGPLTPTSSREPALTAVSTSSDAPASQTSATPDSPAALPSLSESRSTDVAASPEGQLSLSERRAADPYMKGLPEDFDPDNPPKSGPWVIYGDGPPLPANESERLETTRLMGLLDAPEDPVLNSICELACSVFKCLVSGGAFTLLYGTWASYCQSARLALREHSTACCILIGHGTVKKVSAFASWLELTVGR